MSYIAWVTNAGYLTWKGVRRSDFGARRSNPIAYHRLKICYVFHSTWGNAWDQSSLFSVYCSSEATKGTTESS